MGDHRFYGELAEWWPLVSPPAEYEEEAAVVAGLLGAAPGPVERVLELGSGGGHLAFHLKARFALTLTDVSEAMLAVSRRLNPECEHVAGDMRTLRLGRRFDAVLVHDAIDYMVGEADLAAALETAATHCRPGGVAVLVPDHTAESFAPSTGHGGVDGPDGRGARYLEWSHDPDPADGWVLTEYAFLLRERAGGPVRCVSESHRTGLFARATWVRRIEAAGFAPRVVADPSAPGREIFVGRRA